MAEYRLEIEDANAHLLRLTLKLSRPAKAQGFSLPAWAPGSYMVRDFARHVSPLQARQGRRAVAVEPVAKSRWLAACEGNTPLVVSWFVYAFDASARGAFVDAERGFVNGPAVFLRAEGREADAQRLTIGRLPAGWQVATSMKAAGARRFEAADWHELIDHPILLGRFWRGRFRACGVDHEFAVDGAWPGFDGERLLADTRRICETQIRFWHGRGKPPFARYLFMLRTADDGYGGLEHRDSSALLAARRDLPRSGVADKSDGYVGLLALISHEYFHAWNAVRMKAPEFVQPDLAAEAPSRLLWFYEGFTSYYDELMLLRAGLVDLARYLRLLARPVNAVRASPGRHVQSVAEASFDAWTKHYRRDENTANATVSYYDKGALVALLADLALRRQGRSLDEAMRQLWQHEGPVGEAEIVQATGLPLADWVHGTGELPLTEHLADAGVQVRVEPPTLANRLGLKVSEGALTGVQVREVQRASAAEAAGIAAGDELVAADGWRLRRLDDALQWLPDARSFELLVVRDQRLRTLRVTPPAAADGPLSLVADDKAPAAALALRRDWLGG